MLRERDPGKDYDHERLKALWKREIKIPKEAFDTKLNKELRMRERRDAVRLLSLLNESPIAPAAPKAPPAPKVPVS